MSRCRSTPPQRALRPQQARGQPGDPAQRARDAVERRVAAGPGVGGVAGEGLVAAVARQRHLDLAARHLGQVVHRDHRGVGERLVHLPHQPRQQLERARPHHELAVIGAEVRRDAARLLELAELLLLETDAEGLDRLRHRLGHQRHHHAGIDPARQERSERHVGDQPQPHRLGEQRAQALAVVLLAVPALHLDRQRPVALDPHPALVAHQQVPGGELAHPLPDRPRRGDVLEGQVVGDRLRVGLARHRRVEHQRLELGGEGEAAAVVVVVERFDAEPVARHQQAAPREVIERECEHPAQMGDQSVAVLLIEVEQGLGVAGAAEAVAARRQHRLELGPAVELAVVGHPQ